MSDDNPFADSAVVDAMDSKSEAAPAYNPYGQPAQAAYVPPRDPYAKSASAAAPAHDSGANEELRRKEEELRQKEKELNEKQKQIDKAVDSGVKKPNWPVCKPFMYHSIKDEIDQGSQRLVRSLYYSWYLTCACLLINVAGTLSILIAGEGGEDFGVAIMYGVLIVPASFFMWYRPVYNAFMKDSSMYFLIFFVFNGFHQVFVFFMWLGLNQSGGAGLINMIDMYSKGKIGEGAMCTISFILWTMCLAVGCFLFFKVFKVYRSRGHTVAQARNEGFKTAATSDTGRAAMAGAANAAVSGYARQYDEI